MPTVHFDVTRLFVRGSRFSPTGIDRVVMAYATWLLSHPDVTLEPVLTVGGRLFHLRREVLAELIAGSQLFAKQTAAADDPSWTRLVAAIQTSPGGVQPLRAPPLRHQIPTRARWYLNVARRAVAQLRPAAPRPGSLYVNVSHTGLGDPDVLGRISAAGASPVVMVHDLIPIHHPEYCSHQAEARHRRRMRQIVDHAAHVIANSRTTADEFAAYALEHGERVPPVTTIPLGLQDDFLTVPTPLFSPRPYFVCVGTIEARKNLAFLLALWRRLDERLGDAAPMLVIVGRRGWENEAVIDHLDRSKAVLRLVHEVCDLRDKDLASLVAGATALLSPSFAEGFDLPVLEALAVRTPVIASRINVHEELAANAVLVDPLDGHGWLAAVEEALAVRRRGPPVDSPTWGSHFQRVAPILDLKVAPVTNKPVQTSLPNA